MPGMDGYQATREIRRREAGTDPRIPIVALTADAVKDVDKECRAAGMDGYISKPIDRERLKSVLEQFIKLAAAF